MIKWAKLVVGGCLGVALMGPAVLTGQEPVRPQEQPYRVGEALPPMDPGREMVTLSLEEAIARALDSNLDIQSIRLAPELQAWSERAARAAFNPTVNASYGYNNSTSQSTSQLDGGARTTSQRQTFNSSLSQPLPWYGGRLNANFNNGRNATNNAFSTRNPSYSSSVNFSYSQPLLAGFRIDNQRASLQTLQIQADITDLQVASQVETITAQVSRSYWSLRAAIEQIEIQRRSLEQARSLLAENELRVELGQRTELQLLQSRAQVASAEQSQLNAEIQWRNQELAFKRLLMGGADDPLLGQTVNPSARPQLTEPSVDLDAAIARALQERADIRQQRMQREISEVNLDVTRNNTLPTLDMSASYSLQGVGGNLFERSSLGGDPVLVLESGYLDGLRSIADFETPSWSISLSGSYPIGTSSAETSLERARLQLRQTDLALRNQELSIVTQVTSAGLSVQNTFLQLEAARRSREAAEESAAAELARYELGVATLFEVVTAQNSVTSARLSELQATINHLNAIADFDRIQRIGG